ncbi:MAG: SAM-dependent methyltransferase [Clostridia bacterium]|nr:SAM-dependent methyltransferase [Clostridia bacterium]
MQHLKNRLETLCALVPRCPLVADIGADHAYLTIALLERGIAAHVLCTDLSPNSLDKARAALAKTPFEDRVTFCLGDGLLAIGEHAPNAIVIAGMGGETIVDILSQSTPKEGVSYLLQPMTRASHLRRFLIRHGFTVAEERLAKDDGRVYPILRAVRSTENEIWNEVDYICGKAHLFPEPDALTREYLQKIHRAFTRRKAGRVTAKLDTATEDAVLSTLNKLL